MLGAGLLDIGILLSPPAKMVATVIARSKLLLTLGMSASARLIVIRFLGNSISKLAKALRTRSRDSSTALLAEPTVTMFGMLFEK